MKTIVVDKKLVSQIVCGLKRHGMDTIIGLEEIVRQTKNYILEL